MCSSWFCRSTSSSIAVHPIFGGGCVVLVSICTFVCRGSVIDVGGASHFPAGVFTVASSGAGFDEDPVPPPAGKSSRFISYGADLSAFDDVAVVFVGGVWIGCVRFGARDM